MGTILIAIAIMTGLGIFFGAGLAVANKFLRVEEDPRLDVIEGMLPGSNCGACGEAGCRAFAEAVLSGRTKPGSCTVSSPERIEQIAGFLGVDAGAQEKRVARLHCAGGIGQARQIAEYEGYGSCSGAHLVGAGGKGCSWGCLGLADCEAACDFDAIRMNEQRLPVVDVERCTACGDCVEACPRGLFEILPLAHKLVVQCRAPLEGEEARAVCSVACDACGRCAQDAAPGLIRMENNLPVVDYGAGGPATPSATFRCPTGAIAWLEGQQFTSVRLVQLTMGEHGD
jgi:Na+-translocating ferredoxin:NAD+ oxidoreductase RNF subunit RnfB